MATDDTATRRTELPRSPPKTEAASTARLQALRATGLLDSPPERTFDHLTALVCRLLRTPVALVSLVDEDRQFFKSSRGLPEPWASRRETPLSHSFCRHVVTSNEPLVIEDARRHPLVYDNLAIGDLGVVAYLGVPLLTPDGHALGSLCAMDDEPREWSNEDIATLSDLAEMATAEVALRHHLRERKRAEEELRERTRALEALNRANAAIAAELDLEQLIQLVTDTGVELTDARFGAFFHNVVGEAGEGYQLYTLSGAPRAAFTGFPMPRSTAVFGPTFRGEGVVRSGDITQDPHYGRKEPYRGMPEGHLSVRSYLAAPVVSRSGEVLGGLFFGHPEPGVFTELAERLIVGIASQAAIAIDNARLYHALQAELAERRRTEAALRESEALSRRRLAELQAIYATAPAGLCFTDTEHRYVSVNEHMAAINGLPAEAHLGRMVREVLPAPLAEVAEGIRRRVMATGEPVLDTELTGVTAKDPRLERHWLASYYPVRDDHGALLGVNAVVQDVTERKRAEEALRRSEQRFRDFAAAASDWFWETDAEHRFVWFSPNVEDRVGVPRQWHYGKTRLELAAPGTDPAGLEAHRRTLNAHQPFREFEYLRRGPKGDTWLSTSGMPVFDAEGRFRGYRGVSRDITEKKQAEAQRELLLAELSHRIKNTLAVVQALAERTGRGTDTVAAFLAAFRGRLAALAAAHSLLTVSGWCGAGLRELAQAVLEPYLGESGRVWLEVGDAALVPAAAQTFALVFHELATNASKYGALSVPSGRVALSARGERGEYGAELRVVWEETGGPPVRKPERLGFGATMIVQAITHQHGGRAELDWREEGLLCRLSLVLEEATGMRV